MQIFFLLTDAQILNAVERGLNFGKCVEGGARIIRRRLGRVELLCLLACTLLFSEGFNLASERVDRVGRSVDAGCSLQKSLFGAYRKLP